MVRQSIFKVAHILFHCSRVWYLLLLSWTISMATWLTSLILPGADSFEVCRVKSHVESDWSVSTMTDPPPNESYPVNRSKCSQFTNNKVGCSPVGCSPADTSNDPPMTDEALLSTVSFPYHSFMAKYIKEYASTKGFLPLHKCKYYFNG